MGGGGGVDHAHAAPGHGRGHERHAYGEGADDAVTRYKVGLYAYTVSRVTSQRGAFVRTHRIVQWLVVGAWCLVVGVW